MKKRKKWEKREKPIISVIFPKFSFLRCFGSCPSCCKDTKLGKKGQIIISRVRTAMVYTGGASLLPLVLALNPTR